MFKGEKTLIFWLGLIILGLSSIVLFGMVWLNVLSMSGFLGGGYILGPSFWLQVPVFVGAIVFILIGLYMMKSGTKKTQ